MKNYTLLILTDSQVHGPVESIYHIADRLRKRDDIEAVHVADRADARNAAFFADPMQPIGNILVTDAGFQYDAENSFYKREGFAAPAADYPAILLRLPRRNSMEFFADLAKSNLGQRCINRPAGIMLTGSKEFLLQYPELCPPIQLCQSLEDVKNFRARQDLVLKPLNDSGGRGVVRIQGHKVHLGHSEISWKEYVPQLKATLEESPLLAMAYLSRVSEGDKRVIVVHGEIVSAALRIPPPDSWIANVSQGGRSEMSAPTPEEEEIARTLTPEMTRRGVVLYGFDTLVDDDGKRVLSEINTSCVNGIYPAEMHSGKPIVAQTAAQIVKYIHEYIR